MIHNPDLPHNGQGCFTRIKIGVREKTSKKPQCKPCFSPTLAFTGEQWNDIQQQGNNSQCWCVRGTLTTQIEWYVIIDMNVLNEDEVQKLLLQPIQKTSIISGHLTRN